MKDIGFPVSKDTIIDYVSYAEEAYLLFEFGNYYGAFEDKETAQKYYFSDNGLLSLSLDGQEGQFDVYPEAWTKPERGTHHQCGFLFLISKCFLLDKLDVFSG